MVIFGAGATKACGGPLTNEILPDALDRRRQLRRRDHVELVEQFLRQNFSLPTPTRRAPEHFPPLPLVLSLVDTALDRDDAFGADWPVGRLRAVRAALEYVIFALLELRLRTIKPFYVQFLEQLYAGRSPDSIAIVSLNYDLIADNALAAVSERTPEPGLADYGCDIATPAYHELGDTFGLLLKLHGSLNWLYCPNCHRLDLGVTTSGLRTAKMLYSLYGRRAVKLDASYEADEGTPCPDCGTHFRPVLITPTHLKDYRNPHIARVWYEAARELRRADRAIFVGYSMPEDDVDVIYLFKRGLAHVDPRSITVVEHATGPGATLDRHPVGLRYRALFGDEIDWWPVGFEQWLRVAGQSGFAPRNARRRVSRRTTSAR